MIDAAPWVEVAAVGVLALYVYLRFRRGQGEGLAFLRDFAVIAPAAWLAEDSCIRLYGFYEYSPGWHVFLDRVPLAIACIWPAVILSARDLANRLVPGRPWHVVLTGGAIVWLDAVFIECIATESGLWSWSEPGPFGVPLVGPFGWGCFASAVILSLRVPRAGLRPATVMAAPAITHCLLLASWWGLFRWISAPVPEWAFVAATGGMGLALTAAAARVRRRVFVPLDEMLARLAAASVFFGLVAALHANNPQVLTFTATFVPPWVTLMSGARSG